jgi:hypothetical protein
MTTDPTRESLEAIAAEKAFFAGTDHARIAELADRLDLDSLAALDRLAAHLAKRAIRQASITDQLLEDASATLELSRAEPSADAGEGVGHGAPAGRGASAGRGAGPAALAEASAAHASALAQISHALTARAVYIDSVLARLDLEEGGFE